MALHTVAPIMLILANDVYGVEEKILGNDDVGRVRVYDRLPAWLLRASPGHQDRESLVQVNTTPRVSSDPQPLWAVRVPFEVPSASLTIGSVGADHEVNVPAGHYSLVFEALPGDTARDHDYAFVFKFKFCADPDPGFEILKQGGELTTNKVLRKDS